MKKITFLFFALLMSVLSWHGTAQIPIGMQDGISANIPINGLYNFSYSQQIVYQNEINANGDITSISFFFSTTSNTGNNNDWTIYLAHSTKTQFTSTTDWVPGADLIQVFDGIVTFPAPGNWMQITFDTPFTYNNTDNLVVGVVEKSAGWASTAFGKTSDVAGSNRSIYWSSDPTMPNPDAPAPAKARYDHINTMILGGIQQSCPGPTDLVATNIEQTAATLGWTENGSATEWEVVYGARGFDPEVTGTTIEVSTNPTTALSGLSANTAYDFYVKAICSAGDESSLVGPASFRTACDVISLLPYTENFDTYGTGAAAFPACWSRPVIYNNTWPSIVSGNATSAPNSLKFQSDVGIPTYAISPPFAEDIQNLRVSFMLKREGTNSGTIDVGVMSDPTDLSTFELVQTINPADFVYHEYIINLNQVALSGPDNFIALRQNSLSSVWYYWLDDFVVELVPSCIEPSGLTASAITETTADISWTLGGSETAWNISWGPAGYTPGDGDEIGDEAIVATSYQIMNLAANTSYDVYVQADCGGDLSNWAGPLNFKTACGAMTEMFENFDSYDTGNIVPDCWERMVPSTSAGSQTISSTSPASGTRNIYQYTGTTSNSIIVALPEFSNINAGTHWLKLQARVSSGTGSLLVGYVTDVTDYDSFTLIENLNITNNSYGPNSEYTVVVPNTVPAGARLAIKSAANGTSHYWDDVSWEQVPSCLPPTSLHLTGVSDTTADVSWTAGDSETSWNISWGTPGYTPGDANEISTDVSATASYQITGLTAETNYDVYVQADCDLDGESTWAGPLGIYTGYCIPTGSANNSDEIRNFTLSNLDNDSAASEGTNGYSDYTTSVAPAELEAGMPYVASLTSGSGSGNHGAAIWIDLNNNMVFEASEMVAFLPNSIGANATVDFPEFTIPVGTPNSTYRLRVQYHYSKDGDLLNPCAASSQFSETEDYAVVVTGGGGGDFPFPYCDIVDADDVIVEEITKVDFDGTIIENDNTTDVLIDKTDVVVDVTTGETYTLSVEGNTHGDFQTNIVAFIDWNQNGVLDDAGEIYELGTLANSTGDDGISVSMDIDVPADAVLGETRIRITKTYFDEISDPVVTPCGIQFNPFGWGIESGYGQALDFTLNVEEGGGEPDLDCGQGDDSNGFENGFNITAGGDFRNADDFIVSPDNTLHIQSIALNIMAMAELTSLDINFYNDNNGAPGTTIVEAVTGLIPYSQSIIGNAFGFNVYHVMVEVDLEFDGGTDGTSYWMQPIAQGGTAYWEVSTAGTLGEPIHTSTAMGAWEADEDGSQGVFKLYCDVAPPPPFECIFNITSSVEPITRVQMANVDNTSSASSTVALEDFTSIMINAEQGAAIEVALEGNTDGPFTNYFTIFINTGGEEEFSTFEMFEIGSITGSTGTDGQQATATITLPMSLEEGEYLLRVVKNYGSSPTSPCGSYSYGQGEDYTLVIGELEDCSGTPDAGTAMVNPASGNPGSTYSVTATGYSTGNGLTYQWQSNTDGAGWIDEGGLEDHYSSYSATAPMDLGISVEWRLEVTCTFSSETSYSETATFVTAMTYCTPELDCEDGDLITNVTFQEINNTTACSPNGYGDYTAMVATVQSGGTYPISVTVGSGFTYESVSVWIDFDGNGSFDEDEFYLIGTGSGSAVIGDVSIPADVVDGDYRMRVRVAAVDGPLATWDLACDEDQFYGETEDYTVTVDGTVGIADFSNLNFSYYPNPVAEVLYITANKTIESVTAYNVLGQQVINNTQFADGKVDVSSLPTGTYIFRVTFEGGLEENFKVLKE